MKNMRHDSRHFVNKREKLVIKREVEVPPKYEHILYIRETAVVCFYARER